MPGENDQIGTILKCSVVIALVMAVAVAVANWSA